MKYFLVAWISWTCPGGWLGDRAIPAALRPLVCAPAPRTERATNRRQVAQLLLEHQGATLEWCERLRCRPRETERRSFLFVDGQEVSSWQRSH